jgi:hypothetical protein
MATNITTQWRQGETGLGAIYTFSPNPTLLTRTEAGYKQVEFNIPNNDGVQVQTFGNERRIIVLRGTLYAKTQIFEDLEDKRRALTVGFGKGPGQLHLVPINGYSNSRHIYYIGAVDAAGIVFEPQSSPQFLEYSITLVIADSYEYTVPVRTINSNATVV